jgi:predicted transposase/invertase (TIGR01784 family)
MILNVDHKVDYAFKHVFGRPETGPVLIDVVDSVLDPPPAHRIRDIDLLNPFNPKQALDDKLSILDIKARDQSGRQFNVEMQMLAFPHYDQRILYYWAKLHQQQLHEGQDYVELRPTISISFLNHVLFPQVPDYHLRFRLLEESHHFPFTQDIEFHVLELPKFRKTAEDLTSGLDIWLYFLRHAEKMDPEALPAALQRPLVVRALEELKVLTQDDLERERYEARRKALLDQPCGHCDPCFAGRQSRPGLPDYPLRAVSRRLAGHSPQLARSSFQSPSLPRGLPTRPSGWTSLPLATRRWPHPSARSLWDPQVPSGGPGLLASPNYPGRQARYRPPGERRLSCPLGHSLEPAKLPRKLHRSGRGPRRRSRARSNPCAA